MKLSRERKGELSIISSSFLWSIFPVITVLSYNSLSPLVSLLVSTLFSSGIFAFIITQKKLWHEVTNRHALKDILLNTLLIGVGYYTLIFLGLQYTSPGNASIISLTQILFSFLLFHVFRKEHIPKQHVFGAFLMIIGALIVLASSFQAFHIGDILIVVANIIAPIGNLFAQKARKQVASETIMIVRSIVSTGFIFLLTLIFHQPISSLAIQESLPFLLINGVLLLGFSKLLWIDGIHWISVTKATSLSSMEPLLTLLFAWLLLSQVPTVWQLLSIVPICAGVLLLSKNTTKPQVIPAEN